MSDGPESAEEMAQETVVVPSSVVPANGCGTTENATASVVPSLASSFCDQPCADPCFYAGRCLGPR